MPAGEPAWTNAAWLVKIRDDGTAGTFLRASEIGFGGSDDLKRPENFYLRMVANIAFGNSSSGSEICADASYYVPIADFLGRPLDYRDAPFQLFTNRNMLQTRSRTVSNYWLLDIQPENYVEMSTLDAQRLGLKDGDEVYVLSTWNPDAQWDLGHGQTKPLRGKVRTTSRIRPGVVTSELGWGHFAYGASAQYIDGLLVLPDVRRSKGIHANAAMVVDSYLRSPLSDVVGGSAVFYDTRVYVVKA